MVTRIRPPLQPSLPIPPEREYNSRYHDEYNNVLRLYFNEVNNVLQNIMGQFGGQFIECPNGLFFNTTSQSIGAVNVAQPVTYNATYLAEGLSLQNNSEVRVDVGGIYNFQFSGQLTSTNSSSKTVWLWIRRNNVNIGYTTHAYSISGNGTQQEISWNFNIDLQVGQFLELEWAADNINVTLSATAATAPHPGIPSAVMAVNFISPLPDTLPIPP